MKDKLDQVNELIETTGKVADELLESGEERQAELSARHEMDMINGSWLTKNIRPLTLLSLLVFWIVIIPVLKSFGVQVDANVVNAVEMLSLTAFGFYFGSRGFEKVNTMRARADIRRERREQRRNKR